MVHVVYHTGVHRRRILRAKRKEKELSVKYRVHGYAMVPVEAEITVEAESPEKALEIARREFDRDRISLLTENSEDYYAACDWKPSVQPA